MLHTVIAGVPSFRNFLLEMVQNARASSRHVGLPGSWVNGNLAEVPLLQILQSWHANKQLIGQLHVSFELIPALWRQADHCR